MGAGAGATSSSAITVHGKREDALTRGRRLRREREGLVLLARETSRLSFSFPQREVCIRCPVSGIRRPAWWCVRAFRGGFSFVHHGLESNTL